MEKFELVLKNEKIKSYKTLLLFFILLNLGYFIVLAVSTNDHKARSTALLCLIMTAAAFIAEKFYKNKSKGYDAKGAAVIFIILAYVRLNLWLFGGIMLLMGVLYLLSIRQLVMFVNYKKIICSTIPERTFNWEDIDNIILKDGLLTIDLKNNKLIQVEIINGENDYDLDEKEFNEFCKKQLNTAPPIN